MTTSGAEHQDQPHGTLRRHESLDEQVRRRGLKPIKSADDLVCEGAFETDEELDAFLAWYHAERQANLAYRQVDYEQLRADAEAVAADPEDRAEARAVLADMDALRSW